MLLQEIYAFFTRSKKRWERLTTSIMESSSCQKKTIKKVCPTRWSAGDDACQSLRDSWEEVQVTLTQIANDSTEKATSRCKSRGIFEN